VAPEVAIGDAALAFWAALRAVWPETTVQRDCCHELANVLEKLPKRLRPRAQYLFAALLRFDLLPCGFRNRESPAPACRRDTGQTA